jgi:hypothetical protein
MRNPTSRDVKEFSGVTKKGLVKNTIDLYSRNVVYGESGLSCEMS